MAPRLTSEIRDAAAPNRSSNPWELSMKMDLIRAAVAAALGVALAGAALAQKTQLTVYTALETDQIKAYENGFTKVNPNIELKWVRDSTGVITAKLLAEQANP